MSRDDGPIDIADYPMVHPHPALKAAVPFNPMVDTQNAALDTPAGSGGTGLAGYCFGVRILQ